MHLNFNLMPAFLQPLEIVRQASRDSACQAPDVKPEPDFGANFAKSLKDSIVAKQPWTENKCRAVHLAL